jgi:hypothetical protein
MSDVTVRIPEDLGNVMRRHASIDWSWIAQDAIRKAAAELELFDAIASESMLTEEDAIVLGRKVKKGMWEKVYKKLV